MTAASIPDLDDRALAAWLGDAFGSPVTLAERVSLAGGASRETSIATIEHDGHTSRVVVQRRLPWLVALGLPPSAEAAVLQAVARVAPVPAVVAWDDTGTAIGAPALVTAAVEGTSTPDALRRELASGELAALGRDYGRILAALQRTPLDELADLPEPEPLDALTAMYTSLGQRRPVLEFALRWLADQRPPQATADVLVHGDYRHGNALVAGGAIRAVIDWELAHSGSPDEDLAWFLLRAWRYGRAPAAGGLVPLDDFVDVYADAAGRPVDRACLQWWAVHGTVRWGLLCILEGHTHTSGARHSVELAAVAHRVVEAEHDLLLLLLPRDQPRPAAAPSPASEGVDLDLVDAVGELLETRIAPALNGRLRFEARVAARALALVRRQIDAPTIAPVADPTDPAELRARTSALLAVASPAYATGREPGADAEPLASWAGPPSERRSRP